MSTRTPAHGSERYLDFTNAQGLCFRMQVEDDPFDACAFTVRVTPLQGHGEPDASQPAFSQHALLSALTSRERDVALLIAEGFTNDQIALRLCISLSTVKSHIQNIFAKAHVPNRTALVALLHDAAR
jgi:DNA-binding NarL/FixJ family response regulator